MNKNTRCLAAFLVLFAALGSAQAANPSLKAREQGIADDAHRSEELRIAEFDLRIDIVGAVAEATATMKFANPGRAVLEGDLSFQLPDGAVVSGYALDVNGQMIDGVLVEPEKAKRTYETQVRRGIDPGITRTTHANVFSTRIFPILAQGSRTVRLKFVAPVQQLAGWTLPLDTAKHVGRYTVEVRASGVAIAPALTFGKAGQSFESRDGVYLLKLNGRNARLAGDLHLAPVKLQEPVLVTRHVNGRRFFQISDF